jgi:CelD/BcsL family acetyltransferase involved in cellulose biosynthesis
MRTPDDGHTSPTLPVRDSVAEPSRSVPSGEEPRANVSRLELADFDELGADWDRLALASGHIFATREWLRTWWERHGRGERLLVACRTADGRLAAILPLELRPVAGVRLLRFLGHGPSDQMGPICGPRDVGTAGEALRTLLARPPRRYRFFVGRHLAGPYDWPALLGARHVRTEPSPVLRFAGGSWDTVLESFGRGLRKEIRYDTRRLAREHDVRHRMCADPASLSRDLDVLFRLHAAQWGRSSTFLRHEPFHRQFAATALESGWLRLWTLEVDGRPVAVKLNFRYGEAEFSYQGGRDPGWRGPSIGLVNVAHAMRAAFEDGVREYRFLRGGERYKFRFPVHDFAVYTVVKGNGALGHAAVAAGVYLDGVRSFRAARRLFGR